MRRQAQGSTWPWFRQWCLPLGALMLTMGCSSFDRAWRTAGQAGLNAASMSGRWEGTWQSSRNGHHDALRCLIGPETNGVCVARFHARYSRWGLHLRFTYTVPLELQAARTNGVSQFRGEADLGWYAGGTYRYAGEASPTNFFSTYQSRYDQGEFHLHRPPAALEGKKANPQAAGLKARGGDAPCPCPEAEARRPAT